MKLTAERIDTLTERLNQRWGKVKIVVNGAEKHRELLGAGASLITDEDGYVEALALALHFNDESVYIEEEAEYCAGTNYMFFTDTTPDGDEIDIQLFREG